MSLINQEHRIATLTEVIKQKLIEDIDIVFFTLELLFRFNAKFLDYGFQELVVGDKRIEYQSALCRRVQMAEDGTAEGCLSRANTAGNGNKALSFINPVKQMVECLLVMGTQKEVSRIWC